MPFSRELDAFVRAVKVSSCKNYLGWEQVVPNQTVALLWTSQLFWLPNSFPGTTRRQFWRTGTRSWIPIMQNCLLHGDICDVCKMGNEMTIRFTGHRGKIWFTSRLIGWFLFTTKSSCSHTLILLFSLLWFPDFFFFWGGGGYYFNFFVLKIQNNSNTLNSDTVRNLNLYYTLITLFMTFSMKFLVVKLAQYLTDKDLWWLYRC